MATSSNEISRPTTAEPKEKPVLGRHYLNKVQSLWSEASAKQESAVKPLTKEQKLRAMLGFQELAGGQRNPVFWREGNNNPPIFSFFLPNIHIIHSLSWY